MIASDLVGRRIGDITVLGAADERVDSHLVWSVRCELAHVTTVLGGHLLRAARDGRHMTCRVCRPTKQRCCAICHESSHEQRQCPRREKRKNGRCKVCEGLAHRRSAPHCRGCLKPYEPARAVMLAYVHSLPRENRRMEPG